MKYSYQSVVTPSKLINPFHASVKLKQYKPIKTYLELTKFTPRRGIIKNIEEELIKAEDLNPVTLSQQPLLTFRNKTKVKRKKLNKSCKIKRPFETSSCTNRIGFEIPEIKYKEFEPFHLPSVKAKVKVESFKPRAFWVTMKEESEDCFLPSSVHSPSRIEISEHSKEYFTKLQRVSDIVKKMQSEFIVK